MTESESLRSQMKKEEFQSPKWNRLFIKLIEADAKLMNIQFDPEEVERLALVWEKYRIQVK